MAFHPSRNFEIARQRHEELLVRGERQQLVEASFAARDEGRRPRAVGTTSGRGRRPLVAKLANA
jgi:hypothetical protein